MTEATGIPEAMPIPDDRPTTDPDEQGLPGEISSGQFRQEAAYRTRRSAGSGDWLLFLTLAGGGRMLDPLGIRMHSAMPGGLAVYEPDAFQDYSTDPEAGFWEFHYCHFIPEPHWMPLLDWPEVGPGIRSIPKLSVTVSRSVEQALVEARNLRYSGMPRADWFARNALERALLWADSANPNRAHANLDERVRRAMAFISRSFDGPIAVGDVAEAAGLSTSRLAHLFTRETGKSPLAYIEDLRMRRARELLTTTRLPVASVAEAAGYQNAFYFSNRFRKRFGTSPSRYRQSGGLR